MKKLIVAASLAFLLMGCGQAAEKSGFWQHGSMYQDWSHLKFSWFGYTNPTAKDVQESQAQNWWGTEVPYVPGK